MAVQNQRLQQHQQKASASTAAAATTSTSSQQTPQVTLAPMMPSTSNAQAQGQTQPNGGPRVSFNRDVHVKRIGKRPNELTNYETTNLQPPQNTVPYHQLPADLSAESIRKEAALVLAQAERHKSKAENGDNIPTFKVKTKRSGSSSGGGGGNGAGDSNVNPKKFHSLPTRKRKGPSAKPVERSVSDAAAKKPAKRPSIFSIFSRKSDTSINQVERDPRFEDSGGRRLVRSKSDVGSGHKKAESKLLKKALKEPKSNSNGSSKHLPPTQLSPIIENAQKEDLFAEQFSRERRKSDAITDREKHESGLSELLERSRSQAEVDGPLIARSSPIVSKAIKDKIRTLQAKSNENMHSSQLPAQKLPLTKGVTVNGMVKRLSIERFSPPPTLSGPAFSYIRPNEGITYAQLEHDDHQQQQHHHQSTLPRRRASPNRDQRRSPIREVRATPIRDYRSPARDIRSPERVATLNRHSVDRTDFGTSHHNNMRNNNSYSPLSHNNHNNNNMTNGSSRIHIESPTRTRDSFSPIVTGAAATGPTTIRISSSHSPSPWQQLSPRNLSDEDEGLGIETRKYYDDEAPKLRSSRSPTEPPIVPVIRSITPPPVHENGYGGNYREEPDDMGYRRARLESRILTRRFGEAGTLERGTLERNGYYREASPAERYRQEVEETKYRKQQQQQQQRSYLSPEREAPFVDRFHKPQTTEIHNKYSTERSHLDMIAPTSASAMVTNSLPKSEKTSRYKHTKYYDDGRGGVKEVYERETQFDAEGKPHVRESRHRERLDSSADRQQLTDYEPKSLDSQFTSTDQYRSSPENMKRYELSAERVVPTQQQQQRLSSEDHWHSSLKRDKLQQRSFDKGDSGIENDFRKESFNGDITTRWRKRSPLDDMKASDAFLKKERRHTEQQVATTPPTRRNDNYVFRERSIDDGSHYDPHLDKYPVATSTLRRSKDQQSQTLLVQGQDTSTQKRAKKLGGFEKVKQLFTGSGGGGGGGGSGSGGAGSSGGSSSSTKKESVLRANSSASSSATTPAKDKDKYMVKEEEMRSRYREHRVNLQNEAALREPKAIDISMRRRLSTPKASPLLLKRTSSDKTKKESPLAKPEKTSWFKSLDRRAKSKSKEKLNVSVNGQNETSSMKRSKSAARGGSNTSAPPIPPKNLRFFGDTDLDSNPPTVSRANTTLKSRPSLASTLSRSQKYSQSAYHLDRINASSPTEQKHQQQQHNPDYRHTLSSSTKHNSSNNNNKHNSVAATRHKSTSMHNLEKGGTDEVDFRKRRHYSRSRDLDDISESGSETEEQHKRPNGVARTLSRERLDRSHRYDENAYRRSNDHRHQTTTSSSTTPNGGGETNSSSTPRRAAVGHHLAGPPKPARSAERRVMSSYSRDRDRFPAESSGTEGESSLHSQRSIVYLHATTVGAIPQPYHMRRRSISRDDLRSINSKASKNQPLQPMTRTVSRSVSMLAPWKPKLISEGYEINYSQEQNKRMSTLPRKPHLNGSTSTLTRTSKKSEAPIMRTTTTSRRHEHLKDDQSLRNSSTTSASKSALSSNLRTDPRRKVK